ncbi:hypothetical protein MRX96_030719 [Rhipicephalus microplus]
MRSSALEFAPCVRAARASAHDATRGVSRKWSKPGAAVDITSRRGCDGRGDGLAEVPDKRPLVLRIEWFSFAGRRTPHSLPGWRPTEKLGR